MRTVAWITFKLHRFEILAVLIGAALLTAAALLISVRLEGVGVPAECFGQVDMHGSPNPTITGCETVLQAFGEIDGREASPLFAVLFIFPAAAGLILGVPAASRELERGTAPLPWTLGTSRWRWLGARSVVLVGLLLIGLAPLAIAGDHLQGTRAPTTDAAQAFGNDTVRGGVLVAVGLLAFGSGLLVGLITGRQLPGLIAASVVTGLLLTAGTLVMESWSMSVAEVREIHDGRAGDRPIDTRFESADGKLYALSEVLKLQPARPDLPAGTIDDQWLQANFREVSVLVPRERYPQAVGLHSALLAGIGSMMAAAACWLVERRRP